MSGDRAAEPRILPLSPDELGEDALALATRLRANHGLATAEMPETVATMLRHPDLYNAYVDFVTARTRALVLAPRDLEILILRTARLCNSGYIWGEHVRFGRKAGLGDEEIARLVEGSAAPGWSDRDRALVRLTEELHETAHVADETWNVIAAHFSEQQCIELLMMAGAYHEVAYLYNGMRVRLLPGSEGLAAR